jgi:hypothetical protein
MRVHGPALALAPMLALALLPARVLADEPPVVEHQPALCTVPEKPFSLCAEISDDRAVAAARVYFRKAGEDYYAFVDMAFTGVGYCATLPAPRESTKAVEYYVQAVDDGYQATRTSTYQMQVRAGCEFAPLEKDAAKAAAIKVFATHKKQGRKLDGAFVSAGVTFVPVGP